MQTIANQRQRVVANLYNIQFQSTTDGWFKPGNIDELTEYMVCVVCVKETVTTSQHSSLSHCRRCLHTSLLHGKHITPGDLW
jgi:hypothetical protein